MKLSHLVAPLSGSAFIQSSSSFQNRSSIWFVDSRKSLNVIHWVFQSKPLSRSQLFPSPHVSRGFYSRNFLLWPIFCGNNEKKLCLFDCVYFAQMTKSSLLRHSKRNQTPFGPTSRPAQSWKSGAMGTNRSWNPFILHLQQCFCTTLIIQYSAESISTFFHFSFSFQLIVAGQVNNFPKDCDWDTGDLNGEPSFINTYRL